ncbi:hypothetical protein AAMO2058_000897200 [Amorphochlora amoebiformis]
MDFVDGSDGFQQPTYELEPRRDERFLPHQVKKVVEDVVSKKLKGMVYDDEKCKDACTDIGEAVKKRVKELGYVRYKIITQTVIGQVKDQGAYVTSRCLWDHQKDNYASWWFKNVRSTYLSLSLLNV